MKKLLLILLLLILILLPLSVMAKDRCQDYLTDFRKYAIQYNGLDFPWWYNVGCAMAESNCRGDITSFDKGHGILQFTDQKLIDEIRKVMPFDPYNVKSSIRAHAYYMMIIRTRYFNYNRVVVGKRYGYPKKFVEKCGLNLSDVYKFYNGGYWFFVESELGGTVCNNDEMKKHCIRGGTYTDKAKTKWLSFCDVNYSYPQKIYNYAQKYKVNEDGQRYWYVKEEVVKEEVVKEEVVKEEVVKEEVVKEEVVKEKININKKESWFMIFINWLRGLLK
jgi:hypothetical protein